MNVKYSIGQECFQSIVGMLLTRFSDSVSTNCEGNTHGVATWSLF